MSDTDGVRDGERVPWLVFLAHKKECVRGLLVFAVDEADATGVAENYIRNNYATRGRMQLRPVAPRRVFSNEVMEVSFRRLTEEDIVRISGEMEEIREEANRRAAARAERKARDVSAGATTARVKVGWAEHPGM